MKITCKEVVTRFKTIEVSDDYKGMDSSELDECPEIRTQLYDTINVHGWDVTYCHESTFSEGFHEETIYYQG